MPQAAAGCRIPGCCSLLRPFRIASMCVDGKELLFELETVFGKGNVTLSESQLDEHGKEKQSKKQSKK